MLDPYRNYGPQGQIGDCMFGIQNPDGTCPAPTATQEFATEHPQITNVIGALAGPYGSFAVIFAVYWLFFRKSK